MHRYLLIVALLCCACSSPPPGKERLLPEAIAAGWHRTALRDIPPTLAGAVRAFEAVYEGPGRVTVDMEETKQSGVAFEAAQKRRPTADSVFFDKGKYFVIVKWEQVDRKALTAFVRELERQLDVAGPRASVAGPYDGMG